MPKMTEFYLSLPEDLADRLNAFVKAEWPEAKQLTPFRKVAILRAIRQFLDREIPAKEPEPPPTEQGNGRKAKGYADPEVAVQNA